MQTGYVLAADMEVSEVSLDTIGFVDRTRAGRIKQLVHNNYRLTYRVGYG